MIAVINLIIASTINRYSFRFGATDISLSSEALQGYITNLILPELEEDKSNDLPILKSQCLKFILIYRNYIPQDWLPDLLTKLGFFLSNSNLVVRNYAACCIDKLLDMKVSQSKVI